MEMEQRLSFLVYCVRVHVCEFSNTLMTLPRKEVYIHTEERQEQRDNAAHTVNKKGKPLLHFHEWFTSFC